MTVLITGGAGFIGSHLGEALLRRGDRVIAVDNFDPFYPAELKHDNLRALQAHAEFIFHPIDIRNSESMKAVFLSEKIDAVVHLAAKAGVRPSILAPGEYLDVNLNGTASLLEAMRAGNCFRLLFASSSSVYGNQKKMPFSEDDDVSCPISPYAATKRAGELLCHVYHHLYGFDVACLRFFTVYGPRQRPDLAIRKFAQLVRENKPIPLYGDGSTRRDYTYIDDIVQGILLVLDAPAIGYEIFNLGAGNPVTLLDMVHALEAALGRPIEIQYQEKQAGDVEQTHADISKMQTRFGYRPRVSLQEGVRRFIAR